MEPGTNSTAHSHTSITAITVASFTKTGVTALQSVKLQTTQKPVLAPVNPVGDNNLHRSAPFQTNRLLRSEFLPQYKVAARQSLTETIRTQSLRPIL